MRRLVIAIALVLGLSAPGSAEPAPSAPMTSGPSQYAPQGRPSGFWTSTRPAVGGSYRYRLLGIGVALALASGLLIYRVIKKANAERERASM